MTKHYKDNSVLIFLNIFLEYIILVLSFYISGVIRVFIPNAVAKPFWWKEIAVYSHYGFIVPVVMVIIYMIAGDYATVHIRNRIVEAIWVVVVQIVGTVCLATLLFLAKDRQFSRCYLILYALCGISMIYAKRSVCQRIAVRCFAPRLEAYNILSVGMDKRLQSFCSLAVESAGYYHVLGYLAGEQYSDAKNIGYLGKDDMLSFIIYSMKVNIVVISGDYIRGRKLEEILSKCSVYGIKAYILPTYAEYITGSPQYGIRDQFLMTFGKRYKFIPVNAMNKSDILGVKIAVTNMDKAVSDIETNLEEWRGKYICVSNVHTTVMAHDNAEYRAVQNSAVMALPDGGPLSAYSRANGSTEAQRVTGPDLMQEILKKSGEHGWKHFFYGSKQETLDKLEKVIKERYPGAQVAGMISPPFREITPEEDEKYIQQINEAMPDFLWVGLGAPKQEIWMSAHKDRIRCLMIGVGAAFDYEAGNIKRAPMWMQKLSLEWLYRLMQDPKRLFKRYFETNLRYLWMTRR